MCNAYVQPINMKCQKIWLTQTHPIPSQQWLWRHEEQSPLLGWWHSRCWSQRYLQLSTTAGRLTVAWARSLDLNSESHRWQIFQAPRGMCQIPEEMNKQTIQYKYNFNKGGSDVVLLYCSGCPCNMSSANILPVKYTQEIIEEWNV